MMQHRLAIKLSPFFALVGLALTGQAVAQDLSAGSEAKSWNLYAEAPARFEATVVDVLCEIAGDCPDNCGAGARQLALLRSTDNVLVYPMKNAQPIFSGAVQELLPFCGKAVEVDGLLITDPEIGAQNVYLVQKIREVGAPEWVAANQWSKDWAAAHPQAAGEGPWYNRDPRVLAEIATDGYFGLGLEKDAEILKELSE
jgi:hypothetical protein